MGMGLWFPSWLLSRRTSERHGHDFRRSQRRFRTRMEDAGTYITKLPNGRTHGTGMANGDGGPDLGRDVRRPSVVRMVGCSSFTGATVIRSVPRNMVDPIPRWPSFRYGEPNSRQRCGKASTPESNTPRGGGKFELAVGARKRKMVFLRNLAST
jgi:hypothetical protein